MTNKCTSVAGHLGSHGSATVQYEAHLPMEDVQGYIGSHWAPPSGDYLLRIAPAAARITANKATINKRFHIPWSFDGHRDAAVRYRAHRPIEVIQGYDKSHWSPPPGEYCGQ